MTGLPCMHIVGDSVADACLIRDRGFEQVAEVCEITDLKGWEFQL